MGEGRERGERGEGTERGREARGGRDIPLRIKILVTTLLKDTTFVLFACKLTAFAFRKKFSCGRETARCFVSLNISLITQGHSWSFEMTLDKGVSPCEYFILTMSTSSPFLGYSALNNGVTLKSTVYGHK